MCGLPRQVVITLPFILSLVFYLCLAVMSIHRHKNWPIYRVILWMVGVICAIGAVSGPIAVHGHNNFTVHMIGHLLLGMLAPLFMVLAAPMTLILRTLPVSLARLLSRLLRSAPLCFIGSPIVASILNVGGLWLLYTTNLFKDMQHNLWLHLLVHLHIFIAGFVFTSAFIYIDPRPHQTSFFHRAIVLIISLAGHNILSKFIYVHPPNGVPFEQGETGGMLMYYGGDAIDLIIIIIFCFQWYKVTRPSGSFLDITGKRKLNLTKTIQR